MLTKISILVGQQPMPTAASKYTSTDVLEKVNGYIRDVNSNLIDSYGQWQYLKRMYNVLSKKSKLNDTERDIMEVLEPEIMKHAEYDVENSAELDGVNMFKHLKQNDED